MSRCWVCRRRRRRLIPKLKAFRIWATFEIYWHNKIPENSDLVYYRNSDSLEWMHGMSAVSDKVLQTHAYSLVYFIPGAIAVAETGSDSPET